MNPATEHLMRCPVCKDGKISKELWEMLYGKQVGMIQCGSSNHLHNDLKIWIAKQIDEIASHGCNGCWSDSGHCTCKEEKRALLDSFLMDLRNRFLEIIM